MAKVLGQDDFMPHVGKLFHCDGWHGALRLAQVDAGDVTGAPQMPRPPFTLIFHGPRNDILREGFHTVSSETGERFEFYLMPIHTVTPDRQEYQAIFN